MMLIYAKVEDCSINYSAHPSFFFFASIKFLCSPLKYFLVPHPVELKNICISKRGLSVLDLNGKGKAFELQKTREKVFPICARV